MATLVVVTSIGAAFAYHNFHSEPVATESQERDLAQTTKMNHNGSELVVRAFTIENRWGAVGARHSFTGTLQPRYQASMAFRVPGKISERLVEVGQRILKGQVLFRLDSGDLELQLRVAEADQISANSLLKQTAAEESRLIQLRSTNSVSQSDYELGLANRDISKARVDAADRRLTLAKNQLSYCELVADSDGLVTSIQAEAGQVVNVGQSVLTLTQSDELEAVVSLPEILVGGVKKLRATATFWSRPNLELPAELRELSPMADPISRTYDAKFRLHHASADLAIGMTVAILLSTTDEDGLCIPITAIATRVDSPIVWRIEATSGSVEAIPIEISEYRNDIAIIRGAFESGDRIVSAGVQRIDEKSRVRVWEERK